MSAEPATVTFATVVARLREMARRMQDGAPDPGGLAFEGDLGLSGGEDRPAMGLEDRFGLVCERLGLEPLDRAVLAVCAAPEVHPALGRLLAVLHGDLGRSTATPRLVARVLAGPGLTDVDVLVRFDAGATLARTGAVRLAGEGPAADRPAVLGPRAVAYLLGADLRGAEAFDPLRRFEAPSAPIGRDEVVVRLAALLAGERELPLVVTGPDARLVLAEAAEQDVVALDARTAAADALACADLALAAALEDRVPVLDGLDGLPEEGRALALDRLAALPCRPVFCVARRDDLLTLADHPVLVVQVPAPTTAEREAAWRAATGLGDVRSVAERFRLDVERIEEAAAVARAERTARGAAGPDQDLLALGARTASSRRVGALADLLPPGPTWDDLVLPRRQRAVLHSVAAYLCHRDRVLDDWGFRRIAGERGMVLLFSGDSGTGKTLSARVVAGTAGLDVYRVDLAGLFSKWLGETEKNLDRVFTAAEGSNAILFFDEADVVFGKRGEAKGAHDRYANLETAYLLQRIEAYDGVTVLATNLRSNIDEAFLRRLDRVVDFPSPDEATRRLLWRTLLPAGAPLDPDADLDFLAARFELTGGGIRNCTIAAAYAAADEAAPIAMRHLVRAVAQEFHKLGRLTLEADFQRFHELVR